MLAPCMKHIALDYHHFRSHVDNRLISIESIGNYKQNADVLTKPVGEPKFSILRKELNGHYTCAREHWINKLWANSFWREKSRSKLFGGKSRLTQFETHFKLNALCLKLLSPLFIIPPSF